MADQAQDPSSRLTSSTPGSRSRCADLYDWRQVNRDGGAACSVVQQAYTQVRSAILAGSLCPGTKLPSSRDLAILLGVARASVVAAYEQLLAEGYLTAKVGSGTYVSANLSELTEEHPAATAVGRRENIWTEMSDVLGKKNTMLPPVHTDARPFNTGRTLVDARTAETWRRLVHRAARCIGPADLGYADPCGSPELRAAISDYLRAARGVRCGPDQVIVTAGTQHAIDLAARVLLRPGDEAWAEDPGYPLTRQALAAAGVTVLPVPVDAHGLNVAAGTRVAPQARAAFVTPSHQYPTGVVLSMARRLELLAWAREQGAWVIEDDYASEFRYSGRPLASLQGLDSAERVIYVGTLNKALFPGLRLGYAVVPRPLHHAFSRARDLMDRQPPSLLQAVAAEFMRQGHLAAHIRRMRLQYRTQRDALAEALKHFAGGLLDIEVPDQGMHLVAHLRGGVSDITVEQTALGAGLVVRAVSRLYAAAAPRSGLMLGFSGYPREVIVPAAARLAEVVRAAAVSQGIPIVAGGRSAAPSLTSRYKYINAPCSSARCRVRL